MKERGIKWKKMKRYRKKNINEERKCGVWKKDKINKMKKLDWIEK